MSGKKLRLKRFLTPLNGRLVVFPLDHGVTYGPASGLKQIDRVIRMGIRGGADALVLHKGMIPLLESVTHPLPGIIMHLSASTAMGTAVDRKVLVGSVEEAIRRGADGVSVHVNLGGPHEPEMIRDLGVVGEACAKWQMPLLAMLYARGTGIPDPAPDDSVAHGARLAAELGADIIKIQAPRDLDILAEITASLPVPVVIAGGSKENDTLSFLRKIQNALSSGAGGVAVGRNVFQHEHPERLLTTIRNMVHLGFSADEAWSRFRGEEQDDRTP